MADENATPTPNATPDAAAQAAADAARAAAEASAAKEAAAQARLDAIEKRIGALADTVTAAVTPRQAAQGSGKPGEVPAQFRQLLRQQGLTDADIDQNAPIVVPFLAAMLATDGATIAQGIQHVRDEVEMVKAGKNSKAFPYWDTLEDKIVEMRENAAKQGQYLAPKDAYQAAVALDVASADSKIAAANAAKAARAAAAASDPNVQDFAPNQGARQGASHTRRSAMSADEIAGLSRADRRKLFEDGGLGDLPIR